MRCYNSSVPLPLPTIDDARLFRALANGTRLQMIRLLATGITMSVNDFVPLTGMTQDGVSKHLDFLWRTGLLQKVPAPDDDLRRHCFKIWPQLLVTREGLVELECGSCVVRLKVPAPADQPSVAAS